MIKVFMATPTQGWVSDSQVVALRNIQRKYVDQVELVYSDKCTRRIFHDFARNALVEDFLASECDIMWFLDADVTPPDHILDLVVEHGEKWQVAGAPYPVVMTMDSSPHPAIVLTAYVGTNGRGLAPASIPYEGTGFVDGVATGCMFIKRSVFSKLQKPYFEFKFEAETRKPIEGEDMGFCMKLREAGIPVFCDYGAVCKHYKEVCLLEMNNYAINYAQKAVSNYDEMIRPAIMELESRVRALPQRTAPPKSRLILPGA